MKLPKTLNGCWRGEYGQIMPHLCWHKILRSHFLLLRGNCSVRLSSGVPGDTLGCRSRWNHKSSNWRCDQALCLARKMCLLVQALLHRGLSLFYHLRSTAKVSQAPAFYLKRPLEENLLKCTCNDWTAGERSNSRTELLQLETFNLFTVALLRPLHCGGHSQTKLFSIPSYKLRGYQL